MTLKSIRVDGYKPFLKQARLDLKRLTVMFGRNSSGKSSLLRLLPLIADSVRLGPQEPFAVSGAAINGASVADLFCKYSSSPVMTLAFDFVEAAGNLTSVEYKLRNFTKGHSSTVAIEELTLLRGNTTTRVHIDLDSLSFFDQVAPRYKIENETSARLSFEGLRPKNMTDCSELLTTLFGALDSALIALASVTWLGPIRRTPPRIELETGRPQSMDKFGTEASAWLARESSRDVRADVSGWFEQNFYQALEAVPGAGLFGSSYSLAFSPVADRKRRVAVMDTGEGMGQVIPVLVASSLASFGYLGPAPYLVVEHPDLHLHSNVHKGLLDYFLAHLARSPSTTLLLETHSEAMLIALQLAILNGSVSHDDVIVHWVESDESGASYVQSLRFDERAQPSTGNWPGADWFGQLHRQMSDLAKIRIAG